MLEASSPLGIPDLQHFIFELKEARCIVYPSLLRERGPDPSYPPRPQTQAQTHTHQLRHSQDGQACFGNEAPLEAQGMKSCKRVCDVGLSTFWGSAPLDVGGGSGAAKGDVSGLGMDQRETGKRRVRKKAEKTNRMIRT